MDSKLSEAHSLLAEASKALNKKSFLWGKPTPDHDIATPLFDQAANLFRNAKDYENAVEAFIKASNGHRTLQSIFLAAKALENAANILASFVKQPERAADLYRQCSDYFIAHGSPDRGGEMMEKAAKCLEEVNHVKAIEAWKDTCGVYESEDRLRFGLESFKRAIAFALSIKQYETAQELLVRLETACVKVSNGPQFHKAALSRVIVYLSLDRFPDANASFQESCSKMGSFMGAEEGIVAHDLLQLIESGGSPSELENILKSPVIRFIDNEIAKMAKLIKVLPKQTVTKPAPVPPPVLTDSEKQESLQAREDLQAQIEEEGFL